MHLEVKWRRLPVGVFAETDGHTIWIDPDLSQAQRRSTLAHELVHVDRGIPCSTDAREELAVERQAARDLISLHNLAEAIAWSRNEHDVAEELWVDVDIVRARLAGLSEGEQYYIDQRIRDIEETA